MSTSLSSLPFFNPGLPYVGPTLDFLGDPIGFICRGYERHGACYRSRYMNAENLVISGVAANEFVWSHPELWNYPASNGFFGEQLGKKYLIQLEGPAHQEKRRRINQALKPATVMPRVPAMGAAALRKIGTFCDQPADLRLVCGLVMTELTSDGLLDLPLPSGMDHDLVTFQRNILWARVIFPIRRLWYRLPSYRRSQQSVLNFIRAYLDRELANGPKPGTSLAALLEAQAQQGVPVDREELVGDIALLLMAGSDSVGHLILWTLIFLDKNPEWTAALREEVETFDTTTFNGMEKLPKLKATILEIERFRPPTVVLGQVAKQDFEYNGLTVPTGTNLLHVSAMTHFMPEFYEAPHAFKPERFLGLDAPKARMHGTFGGGPHVCAGQFISRVQAPLVLALFLKHFTWEFLAPVSGHAVVGSSITPREKELPVRIRKR